MNIFISYSSRDREQVKMLVQDLQDSGHTVWFDQELSGGQAWWDRIMENIRACDLFIMVLTPTWLASNPCSLEHEYAAALGKPRLPVLIAEGVNVRVVPADIQALQIIDYTRPDRDSLKQLMRAINALPSAPALPDSLPAPPPAPISPLAGLASQLQTRPLTFEIQAGLVLRLKGLLNDPLEGDGARDLLRQLRQHPDALAAIAGEIDTLLGGSTPAPPSAGLFDVILTDVGPNKISVIKVIRLLTGLGLKEAKDLADSPPGMILEGVTRPEAEDARRQFEEVGATAKIVPRQG